MGDAMVTGRVAEKKKQQGLRVLQREGLNTSQAINLMFDRLIEEGNADFLSAETGTPSADRWQAAARFVDGLSRKKASRFDTMSKAEVKRERLAAKGLM